MRVLVCGGRDYSDRLYLYTFLDSLRPLPTVIISGAARGADSMAADWAKMWGIPCIEFPADWDKYAKAAGHIRNQQMLDEGKPDLVVAFPGGRGTANMVNRARNAGVRVIEP